MSPVPLHSIYDNNIYNNYNEFTNNENIVIMKENKLDPLEEYKDQADKDDSILKEKGRNKQLHVLNKSSFVY
jgi:hypothetical protein